MRADSFTLASMAVDYLGQRTFDVAVLPSRVGYLIRPRSASGFRRAVQEACTRWGGITELIIPVATGGRVGNTVRSNVAAAKLQQLVNVDVDASDAAVAGANLGLGVAPLKYIDRTGDGRFTAHPAFIAKIPEWVGSAVIAQNGKAPLWQVAAAGDLTGTAEEEYKATALSVWRPDGADRVGRAQFNHSTLIDLTGQQFSEHRAENMGPRPAVVWLTEPGSLRDCIAFWNYRALQPRLFERAECVLLPLNAVDDWLSLDKHVGSMATRPDEVTPDVLLISQGLSEDRLDAAATRLGLIKSAEQDVLRRHSLLTAPMREPPFTYLSVEASRGLGFLTNYDRSYGRLVEGVAQAFRGRTELRFTNPVAFSAAPIILMRFGGSLFDGYPRRRSVATLIQPHANWADDRLEVRTNARRDIVFSVSLPSSGEVVAALLGESGLSWKLSDKGKLASALLENPALSLFLNPEVHVAVNALMTPRSRAMLNALKESGAVSTDTLSAIAARFGGRVERRYMAARQIGGVGTVEILEQLADAGFAERGFEVACTTCGMQSFVPMVQTGTTARCPGCRSAQRFSRHDHAVDVYYRLDSLIDRIADQGVLPHLQAVAVLVQDDPESYVLPGVDITTVPREEADLVGVYKGEFLVGEAKTSETQWTTEQIDRDLALARRLKAQTYLIAAAGGISGAVLQYAEASARESNLKILCIRGPELVPLASQAPSLTGIDPDDF